MREMHPFPPFPMAAMATVPATTGDDVCNGDRRFRSYPTSHVY